MTSVQPADLRPADWLRAVEIVYADDGDALRVAPVLAACHDARIGLCTPSVMKMASKAELSRERVTAALGRLQAGGAIQRRPLLAMPLKIRVLCSRQWLSGSQVTVLLMSWAAGVLDPIGLLTAEPPSSVHAPNSRAGT